ncbi:MAG: beta-ketoacyl synthase [Isosphaera sp.]|nr:beta-ketoacyl synthase [Isosphaera sp.]
MPTTLTDPAAPPAPPASGWDTEVFVLRGDDRADLRGRALALADRVERQPGVTLSEVAAGLAADLAPGGSRLGAVSGSAADLAKKLRRTADRLADPNCKQIRDAAGVYFFDQPLYAAPGSLALLFPGEGAQYPGMLADLCGVFPEVEETFAWCDQLAAEAGRPSLRAVLHPAPEDRAAAEAELRKLGPSIFGVLVADQAVIRVLWNLHLPVGAVAGHSAGEIAALLASGAMGAEKVLGPRLADTMDLMQRQEEQAGGPDVTLLAVGAGRAAVEEVAAGGVVVAMDNCPHQCVAVGPTPAVAAVEAALLARGLVCERLPFRRPYHTPLFEPWMGPFRDLFAPVPFERPHTPVYSCSTGARFPDDPDAVRDLAVNHWVSPVEFARMIETMYADGVRLFVEAGPRGNLSAFVEDVLRGRPFAALPANVARKSGPTQINHLVAQLAAHHVPLNLGHLYAGRVASWTAAVPAAATEIEVASGPPQSDPIRAGGAAGTAAVQAALADHLAVMERFLDVQREVMTAFLSGRAGPAELPPELLAFSDFDCPPPEPLCLVGDVVRHDPGREIVFRRPLDEREDLYADDHTLGGRGVSRADPGQNGLPVLPMTFSLEAMAEAATLLAPGKVVTAVRDVRLYRWLPFDPDPTTLEVRAAVTAVDPAAGTVEVRANVRDLGNTFLKDAADKPACEAVVVLADRYPDPPDPLPFRLTDEAPCRSTVEDLRRNMFHGPLFQMLRTLDRVGREGIQGTLEVQPRDRWFRSNPDPAVVIDPVLVDAAMHLLGAWHLEQPDWTGRILLPIGMKALEFFGPPPPVGSRCVVRGHNEEETARQARHGLEVFGPDGRLWYRLTSAGYWRFYLPFGHVNFFGPKDEYYLSRRLADAEAAVTGRCHFLEPPVDLTQPVLRAAGARVTMTPAEQAAFNGWAGTDAELTDWFFGRMLAKDAVRAAWAARHGEAVFPADIETEAVNGRVVCRPRGGPKAEPFPPVAVAAAKGKVAAFAAFADRVGVALVPVPKGGDEAEARAAAAELAVADAGGGKLRVRTARHKDVVVATAASEVDP